MQTKICSQCKIEKFITDFHKRSSSKDGYSSYCGLCDNLRSKEYQKEHKDEIREKRKEYWKTAKDKLAPQRKEYRNSHKQEIAEANKRWAESHKDNTRRNKRAYYDRNKETALERSKQWDKDNPERALERYHRYNKRFPEIRILASQRRRCRVRCAPGRGVTSNDWKKILEFYGNKCLKCGSTKKVTLDHVIPLFVGGWHDPINIQPLCLSCNSGKRDKIADYRPRNEKSRKWLFSSFGL